MKRKEFKDAGPSFDSDKVLVPFAHLWMGGGKHSCVSRNVSN